MGSILSIEQFGCEKLILKIGVRGDNFARRATDTLRLFSGPGGVWGGGAPPAILVRPGPGGGSGGAQPPQLSSYGRDERTKNYLGVRSAISNKIFRFNLFRKAKWIYLSIKAPC